MSNETDFSPGREEARAHSVLAAVRRKNESRVRVVELARDGEHLRFGQPVSVEHNPGRVARETFTSEGIDLVDLDLSCHE